MIAFKSAFGESDFIHSYSKGDLFEKENQINLKTDSACMAYLYRGYYRFSG